VHGEPEIHDDEWQRGVRIHGEGSTGAVVRNPWQQIAAGMADPGDQDYRRMICVETTNAEPDVIGLEGGAEDTLAAGHSRPAP